MSPPLTCRSRSTTRLLLTLVVPVAAPTSSVVAAPAKFTVVATVLNTFCVVCDPTTVGLRSVIVPVVAPRVKAVAAPAKLTVVALVFNRLNVV